jgi:hypothetical protein
MCAYALVHTPRYNGLIRLSKGEPLLEPGLPSVQTVREPEPLFAPRSLEPF